MKIKSFVWNEGIISHIGRHNVTLQEVEEVCYYSPLILRGKNNRYYVLGQTISGRYLTIIIEYTGKSRVIVITARDMDNKEKRRFTRR